MAKYIDAEDLTSTIRKVRTKYAIESVFGINLRENAAAAGALEAVAQVIDIMPAADVVEVKHYLSEWCTDCKEYDKERHCCPRFNRVIEETVAEMKSDGWQKVRHGRWELYDICSVCGAQADQQTNYCPNCGARMDEVTE